MAQRSPSTLSHCDLYVFAGEKSGDLHGESVIQSLLAHNPNLTICGVTGPRMRALGVRSTIQMEQFEVMGFVDVFLVLPKLIKLFYRVRKEILSLNPKAVLLIDYAHFNLKMGAHLRKKGYKNHLFHFISPSVWAWGKKRIPLMAQTLDGLFSIFPFEKKSFENTKLPVHYVGNPLVKKIHNHHYTPIPFPDGKKIISLFPGSRRKEIERNLPIFLAVVKRMLKQNPNLIFPISASDPKCVVLIRKLLQKSGLSQNNPIEIIPAERTYDLMHSSHLALAKSGTVTLELALHNIPSIVVFSISKLDVFIARSLLKIHLPHYCLVNIIGEKEIFQELIGPALTEESLFTRLDHLLFDHATQNRIKEECSYIKNILSNKDAGQEVADLLQLVSLK